MTKTVYKFLSKSQSTIHTTLHPGPPSWGSASATFSIYERESNHFLKPFFKIDRSRNLNEGGSGLGLSIANELVKKLKGKIYLKDSKKLKGSASTTNKGII